MKEIFLYFLKLGCLGFGGPLALVAQMQKDLVQERKWMTDEEFIRVFSLIKAMPGPVAFQTAVYLSQNRKGFWGGLLAGIALILPAALLMILLAGFYEVILATPWLNALVHGMQIGAFALILLAIKSLANPFLKKTLFWFFMVVGLVLALKASIPEPILILVFGVIAIFRKRILVGVDPTIVGTLAWVCFKAGAFIFGTGLAFIPILQRDFVDQLGWVTRSQFLDAVSFGQLTPGPVSVTVTFIGFKVAGLLGAVVATVAVFLPSFVHMTTWFPKVVNWLSKQNWILDFTLGVTAAVIATIIVAVIPMAQSFSPVQSALAIALLGASFAYPVPGWGLVLGGGILNLILANWPL